MLHIFKRTSPFSDNVSNTFKYRNTACLCPNGAAQSILLKSVQAVAVQLVVVVVAVAVAVVVIVVVFVVVVVHGSSPGRKVTAAMSEPPGEHSAFGSTSDLWAQALESRSQK